MIFTETALPGVYEIDLDLLQDERGFFARAFCRREFTEHNLNPEVVQCNFSFNRHRGTIRGMHLQLPPHAEDKLVRVISGAIYDVVVDLRLTSPTYLNWISIELSGENHKALFVPKGLAHGFQTLADNTEVFYQMSEFYEPSSSFGFRWNDSTFKIKWPLDVTVISERDQHYPEFSLPFNVA
jgi:dTDP-4-dehydrorhamnose 3,5-epimerase